MKFNLKNLPFKLMNVAWLNLIISFCFKTELELKRDFEV